MVKKVFFFSLAQVASQLQLISLLLGVQLACCMLTTMALPLGLSRSLCAFPHGLLLSCTSSPAACHTGIQV